MNNNVVINTIGNGNNTLNLVFNKIKRNDSGVYTCFVKNYTSDISKTVNIMVQGKNKINRKLYKKIKFVVLLKLNQ